MTKSERSHPFEGPEVFDDHVAPPLYNGGGRVYLVPKGAIADPSKPTMAEIEAGVDVTTAFRNVDPWPYTSAAVEQLRQRHLAERRELGYN
jgi:hypothetical protein